MAEPMSIIAGVSAVAGLADASCSLAGSLYKTFRAIKDAPGAVQRLSKELGKFHDLLEDVHKLLQSYSTSLIITKDGLSIDSVQSVLQECERELESVQKTAATFEKQPSKLKNTTARIRWVVDEHKIKQHCQTIEQLRRHLNTGFSVLSHHYVIKARERDESLHSQVTEVRNVLDTSATETRILVSSEFGTVRSDIEQVAVKVAVGQERLQKNIQTSHDHLYQEVSHAGVQTSYGIERIQNDLRDTNLLMQRDRQHTMQEFLHLNQSIKNIDSMLSQVLLLYSEREESLPDSSLAQHPRLEGIMLSLLMMKSSLVSALSELKSKSSLDISDEEIEFLLNEFETLVAFSHEASALRIRQRCIKAVSEDRPSRRYTNRTSMTRNYALDVDSLSQPTMTRRERLRTLSHANNSGILKLRLENRAGDVDGRSASVLNATFSYIPNLDVNDTGIHASFRKEMRMGLNPSIKRSLRVIRIRHLNDSVDGQLRDVIEADDLYGLQRMLSCGELRPWDQDKDGWNLLTIAVFYTKHYPCKILDYLLMGAWDVENSGNLHVSLLGHVWASPMANIQNDFWTSGGLDPIFQLSRRISAAGQAIAPDIFHDIVRASTFYTVGFRLPAQLDYNDIFQFVINQGADIESRNTFRKETALLVIAEADTIVYSKIMPVFLRFDADYSAVDYKGRGPLHLALKPSRTHTDEYYHLGVWDLKHKLVYLRSQTLKDKLVHLLQAGCSIHAVDNYGRTPTDVAQKWRRTKAWEAALEKVGKLDCGRSECQCEIITEHLESSTGHSWETNSASSEDSEVDPNNVYIADQALPGDEEIDRFSEISGDSEQDGDADEDEDQDADTDSDEPEDQWTDTDEEESEEEDIEQGKHEDEALNETLDIAVDKRSPRNEDKLDPSALSTSQISKPNPSPTPEPHHETIALGQHHLWMV